MDNLTRILDTYNSKFNSSANILQKVLEDLDYEIAEKIKKLRENIY